MQNLLEVKNLVKNYGAFRALDGISFAVPHGRIVGLLGPNGAGKTTTIHILLGIVTANGGTVRYFGKDFTKHRRECLARINFASSFNTLQGRISVWENLLVFAALYGVKNAKKKISDLVEYFEIGALLNTRFWDLSAGQKTRVNLVKSLLNDPALILMDEPTASLDPDIADKMLSLVEELNKSRGLSLLYTSHNMAEVARICHEVVFLDRGRVVAHDTPLGLTKRIGTAQLRLTFEGGRERMQAKLAGQGYDISLPNAHTLIARMEEENMPELLARLHRAKIRITNMEVEKPTLEDVFLNIARGRARPEHVEPH